jgi:TusA-related sulfurtransferase
MKTDRTIDCIGLYCPMPIVKTKLELENMNVGEVLEVVADDPGIEKDLPNWCQMSNEEFLGILKEGDKFKGYVRKK